MKLENYIFVFFTKNSSISTFFLNYKRYFKIDKCIKKNLSRSITLFICSFTIEVIVLQENGKNFFDLNSGGKLRAQNRKSISVTDTKKNI